MQPVSKLLVVAALAAAFSSPANALTHQFVTALDGAQAGTSSTATGSGTLSYDDVTKVLDWNISFSGLSGTETFSHFHGPAAPGDDAAPQITLPLGSPKIGNAVLDATQEAQLLDQLWYVNVHSTVNPAGEIRGQLLLVPEPEAYALMAVGIGLVGLVARRRRR